MGTGLCSACQSVGTDRAFVERLKNVRCLFAWNGRNDAPAL